MNSLMKEILALGWFDESPTVLIPEPESNFHTVVAIGIHRGKKCVIKLRPQELLEAQEREVNALNQFSALGLRVPSVMSTISLLDLRHIAIVQEFISGDSLDLILKRNIQDRQIQLLADLLIRELSKQFDAQSFPVSSYHGANFLSLNRIIIERMMHKISVLPPLFDNQTKKLLGIFTQTLKDTLAPRNLTWVTHDWCARHIFFDNYQFSGLIDLEFAAPADPLVELANFSHDLLMTRSSSAHRLVCIVWKKFQKSRYARKNWQKRTIVLMLRQALNLAASKYLNGCSIDTIQTQLTAGAVYAEMIMSIYRDSADAAMLMEKLIISRP
jgi:aminoglycoside phosphotransferase